jgi:peptidoglycan/xylan/chitin deacetylase (PgdA/CDA1 family)
VSVLSVLAAAAAVLPAGHARVNTGPGGTIAILQPAAGAVLHGRVPIAATDSLPLTTVRFEWTTDGTVWNLIGEDTDPSDGFLAVWDTSGFSGRAVLRVTDSDGNQTHVRVRIDNKAPLVALRVTPVFSPNDDGRLDVAPIRVTTNETSSLTVQVLGPRGLVVQNAARDLAVAAGRVQRFPWDGWIYDGARHGRDGLYSVRAVAVDAAGNQSVASAQVRLDTRPPSVRGLAVSPQKPAGNSVHVRFGLGDADERLLVRPRLVDASGDLVRSFVDRRLAPGPEHLTLAFRAGRRGGLLPGSYRVGIVAVDEAGNRSDVTDPAASFLVSYPLRAHVWGRFEHVGRRVALTFDDCTDTRAWAGVLKVLAREQVPATFFCIGRYVLANPGLALRTVREGHAIGSHGWDHANFATLSFGSSVERLLDDRNVWWRIARVAPMPFFRPPYGAYTSTTVAAAGAAGYAAVVLWDVDPYDWRNPGVSAIVDRVVGATTPGAIDLMHTVPETVAALPTIIAELRARGFSFATLPQLAALGTPTPGHWQPY